MPAPDLSVIVPLAAGEALPHKLLETVSSAPGIVEVLLSRVGQPGDPEPDVLGEHSTTVRIVTGERGRGRQLNRAARLARGKWLWFLHADCQLDVGAVSQVLEFVHTAEAALGWCRLEFLPDGPWPTRLNACGANLRSRLLRLPYGDQGLVLPVAWFERLGGFKIDLERGEDLDLVVRAGRTGLPIRPTGATIKTSARRYRQFGWLRTTLHHQWAALILVRRAWRWRP